MKDPENVLTERTGDILTLRIDLSQSHGWTKSRSNILIATTYGTLKLDDDTSLTLTCYRHPRMGDYEDDATELLPSDHG